MRAQLFSVFLEEEVPFPFIALVVSGGHTVMFEVRDFVDIETLGHTRDDAAGEAFDKVAKFLGLGYPGGEVIDRLAKEGNPDFAHFPRAFVRDKSLEFSFSGLKTAVVNYVRREGEESISKNMNDICASFQEAVVDVLVEKIVLAGRKKNIPRLVLAGGVAANSRLREKLGERVVAEGMSLFVPEVKNCTDNALMIAYLGAKMYERGILSGLDLNSYPTIRY